jgi:hypothetical protein
MPRRRRTSDELKEKERWYCPNEGCDMFFKKTSTVSMRNHKLTCELPKPTEPFNTKTKRKKEKQKNGPKAASNAYMLFCQEKRAQVRTEHSDLTFGQVTQLLGEMWRNMSDDDKFPYNELAQQDKGRYTAEMEKVSISANKKRERFVANQKEETTVSSMQPVTDSKRRRTRSMGKEENEDENNGIMGKEENENNGIALLSSIAEEMYRIEQQEAPHLCTFATCANVDLSSEIVLSCRPPLFLYPTPLCPAPSEMIPVTSAPPDMFSVNPDLFMSPFNLYDQVFNALLPLSVSLAVAITPSVPFVPSVP